MTLDVEILPPGLPAYGRSVRPSGRRLSGCCCPAFAWFAVAAWEDRIAARALAVSASNRTLVLQGGIDHYLNLLDVLRAFFNASEDGISRDEFNAFAGELLNGRKAILALSWIPRVTRDERARHELTGAREGIAGYRISIVGPDGRLLPAPEKDEYFPVFYSKELQTTGA